MHIPRSARAAVRVPAALALVGAAAVLLAGCSAGSAVAPSSAEPASTSAASPGSTGPSASRGGRSEQDVAFTRDMAMHHRQAVEMADVLLAKRDVPTAVTDLAERIRAEQQPEIEQMDARLRSWGEAPSTGGMSGSAGHSGAMGGGMMSAADMERLQQASGTAAGTLFLQQMIAHHRGALAMARTELARGSDPASVALAKRIVAAQTEEIAVMQRMLRQG